MITLDSIHSKFHIGVRWNFAGSLIYEAVKALHNLFLFSLLDHAHYGLLGSTLSIIYLSSKIADFGASTSLPAVFNVMTKSRKYFRFILWRHYLRPHIPLIIIVALTATAMYGQKFSSQYAVLIIMIIFFETIRYFLRLFLHASFKSKSVVIIEVVLFLSFVIIIWSPHLIWGQPLSLHAILIAHVIDSCTCVALFLITLAQFYRTLPEQTDAQEPSLLKTKNLISTKATTYTLRLTRDLFTSNFLTPLLALKCGFGQAGIFYLATTIVSALQSIIKQSIHYPAHGLLSRLKECPLETKKKAFSMLCQKLTRLITPVVIFLMINYRIFLEQPSSFLATTQPTITTTTLAIALTFLLISLIESFFMLYEQFYILENASARLCFFKILEFGLFYFLVIQSHHNSIVLFVLTIATIKLLSFTLTTLNAFTRWQIIPSIKLNVKSITLWCALSLIFFYFSYIS